MRGLLAQQKQQLFLEFKLHKDQMQAGLESLSETLTQTQFNLLFVISTLAAEQARQSAEILKLYSLGVTR